MPNRMLRGGILTSDRVNALPPKVEVFYRRMMSVVDDYGRFDGDARVLRSSLYPLCVDQITEQEIEEMLSKCAEILPGEKEPLVLVYRVDRKRYIAITNFRQKVRSKQSKYPAPPQTIDSMEREGAREADDLQMPSTCDAHAASRDVSASVSDSDSDSDSERHVPRKPPQPAAKQKSLERVNDSRQTSNRPPRMSYPKARAEGLVNSVEEYERRFPKL